VAAGKLKPPFLFKEIVMAREKVEVPITGKILSVLVKVGDKVNEGDTLAILESMKMENPIVSPVDGTVVEIGVTPDTVVRTGETIAVIEY
jgi:biotin carboxyl carrier protein